jgi:hypothetical protein
MRSPVGLQMRKAHLHLLALIAGSGEGLGAGQFSRLVARGFVDVAADLARRLAWTELPADGFSVVDGGHVLKAAVDHLIDRVLCNFERCAGRLDADEGLCRCTCRDIRNLSSAPIPSPVLPQEPISWPCSAAP